MGVIFNNLRVGRLEAGDRQFEEGGGLGAACAHSGLGSWHTLGILAGGGFSPVGRGTRMWPKDRLV